MRPARSVAPVGAHRQNVRLGRDADKTVEGEHGDGEGVHPADAAVEVKEVSRQGLAHTREPAHRAQAERDEQERQGDDQEALHEVRVGRGDQSAEETVEKKRQGHDDDHAVGRDHLAAGGDGDDLAGTLEHHALAEDEKSDAEEGVGERELAAIAVLDDLRDGGAFAAAVPRSDQPVERRDQHVLPLKPDGGEALAKGGARLRHRLLRMGARAKGLADHYPPRQFPVAEKITTAGTNLARNPQTERGDADKVAGQHRPIQCPETGRTRHVAFSVSRCVSAAPVYSSISCRNVKGANSP